MRRTTTHFLSALALIALTLVGVVPPTPASATITPSRIALIVMENQTYKDIAVTGCQASPQWDPYICSHLVEAGGSGTGGLSDIGAVNIEANTSDGVSALCASGGMCEGVQHGTSKKYDGSSYMYMYMTSGDACNGLLSMNTGDSYWNAGSSNSIFTTNTSTGCGKDIFNQMDSNTVTWKSYAEDFANYNGGSGPGTTTCDANVGSVGSYTAFSGYSDNINATGSGGANHAEYTRKHNPATFYNSDTTDCTTNGNVINFPGYATSDNGADSSSTADVGTPFASQTLPSFSFITPDVCHDMHNWDQFATSLKAGGIPNGSSTFTATTGTFSTSDIGKQIDLTVSGTSNQFVATITGRTSSTVVTLSPSAPNGNFATSSWSLAAKANCETGAANGTVGANDAWPSLPTGIDGTNTGGTVGQFCNTPANTPSFPGSNNCTSSGQIYAGDDWLKANLPGILDDLGPTGVAIVTWDEDGCGGSSCTSAQQIPTFVVPGTGGSLDATTGKSSATDFDLSSIYKTIIDNYGLSHTAGTDVTQAASDNYDGAGGLPVALNPEGSVLHTYSNNATATGSSYTVSISTAPVVGHYLILGVAANAGTTVSAPSGWSGVTVQDAGIFYHKVLTGETWTSVTGGLSPNAAYAAQLEEVSGLNATEASVLDVSNTSTSGSMTVPSEPVTSAATSHAADFVVGFGYTNGNVTQSATGYALTSVTNTTNTTGGLGTKKVSATGAQTYTPDWTGQGTFKARTIIIAFKQA